MAEVLRENLQRAFLTLEQPESVSIRGQSEWEAYGFEPSTRTMHMGDGSFVPLSLSPRRGEGATFLTSANQIGWSAVRMRMLPLRDFDQTMWRLSSAWGLHFAGFELVKVEGPHDGRTIAKMLRVPFDHADRPGLYVEHRLTGPIRFELPA